MSRRHEHLGRLVGASALIAACQGASGLRPSDCARGHADSTCAGAVHAETSIPLQPESVVLYQGTLAQGPYPGYEYWGFDFASAEGGTASSRPFDMFVNRSGSVVIITFSFDVPTDRPCGRDCLPGIEFKRGLYWTSEFPELTVANGRATTSFAILDGQSYGWIIGLWEPTSIGFSVTVAGNATATLRTAGLDMHPDNAVAVPAVVTTCGCWDGSTASCSKGTRYSNGLMGPWWSQSGGYTVADSWSNCPPENVR